MKTAFSLVLFALFIGCSTAPEPLTPQQVQALDYGAFPDNYEQLARAYFEETLTNPKTVEYRFGKPFKGYLQHGEVFDGNVFLSGYFLDVWMKSPSESEQHVLIVMKNGNVLMQLSELDMKSVKRETMPVASGTAAD